MPHSRSHRHPSVQKTLSLQGDTSITARSPVESHAGPAPRPLSSACHYPLRLSEFRGVEEGLKSFEEKQVGLERRLLSPHLPGQSGSFAFPGCAGTWESKKQLTHHPSEEMLGRVGFSLDRRFKRSSSPWVPPAHPFIFPFNTVY